jgi:hypothetical protein
MSLQSGEISTFWTNTIGGGIGIGNLSDQVGEVRRVSPGAIPVIALQSVDMPTQYKSTKPRPHFKILSWRMRDNVRPQQLLTGPEVSHTEPAGHPINTPTMGELMNDELPEWNDTPSKPIENIPDVPKKPVDFADNVTRGVAEARKPAAASRVTTNKKGVTKITLA